MLNCIKKGRPDHSDRPSFRTVIRDLVCRGCVYDAVLATMFVRYMGVCIGVIYPIAAVQEVAELHLGVVGITNTGVKNTIFSTLSEANWFPIVGAGNEVNAFNVTVIFECNFTFFFCFKKLFANHKFLLLQSNTWLKQRLPLGSLINVYLKFLL